MKKYLAEFFGTYILVFCGTGAIIINELSNGVITHLGVSLTFGAVVLAMIHTFGEISGAHINPAVTLAFGISGKMDKKEIIPYISWQVLGALMASITLKYLFPKSLNLGSTLPSGEPMQSFILEIILSFILMLVIINVSKGAKEKGITAGIAISSVVAMEAIFAGPISGASMNPARSIGPAIISGNFFSLWIYLTAPIIGAVFAVLLEKIMHRN